MVGTYDVSRKDKVVGRCQITKQGLYYLLTCNCSLHDGEFLRLYLQSEGSAMELGVLVPEGDSFTLKKKLPIKSLKQGRPSFYLAEKGKLGSKFIAVYPEEPFKYLSRIKNSYYAKQEGQSGIVLRENS